MYGTVESPSTSTTDTEWLQNSFITPFNANPTSD